MGRRIDGGKTFLLHVGTHQHTVVNLPDGPAKGQFLRLSELSMRTGYIQLCMFIQGSPRLEHTGT